MAVSRKSPVPAPLVLLVALVIPGISAAGPPDPAQSTVLPWDNYHQALVSPGTQSGIDRFTVTVRDAAGVPLPGVTVEASFSVPPIVCIGSTGSLTNVTNANGQVLLDPLVGGCGGISVTIKADGIVLRTFPRVVSPDVNASGRVDSADSALVAPYMLSATYWPCADYNGDNFVNFSDAVIFSSAFYNYDSQDSCLAIPPPQAPGDTIITTQNVLNWYDQTSGMRGVYSGNLVEPLVDAPEAYAQMRIAMAAASGPTDFIYMLNWWMDDTYPTDPVSLAAGTKLSSIFAGADARGVMLRAMLYSQPLQLGRINLPQVYRLMSLRNGAAILDEAHLPVGSHHQKIMLVRNGQGLTGFWGGIDWNADRLYPQGIGANRSGDTAGAPLHDVHCKMQGPATWELLQIFNERWYDQRQSLVIEAFKPALRTIAPIGPLPGAHHWVQVGRTYPNGSTRVGIHGIPPFALAGYSFAPTGEQTAGRMIIKGIMEARKFIYVEDQYFVDTEPNQAINYLNVRQALIAALQRPGFEHLTVLVPHSSQVKDQGFPFKRKAMIDALKAVGGSKVRIANDLNDLIDPGSGWLLLEATGINDQGLIVGRGVNPSGKQHAFLLTATVSGVPADARVQIQAIATPNPSRGAVHFRVTVDRELSDARIAVFDIQGHLVHRISAGVLVPGRQTLSWDGNVNGTRPVAAGLYFYRLEYRGGSTEPAKLLILK